MNEGGAKSSMISTTAKPSYQYSTYDNKYSSTNYTSTVATTGLARKYSYLDLNTEASQPNVNTVTTPYNQAKEGFSYGATPTYSASTNYNTVANKASYTPTSSNLTTKNEMVLTNKQSNQNYSNGTNLNNYSSTVNNYSSNNSVNTPNLQKQMSNSNPNNYSDLVSYNPNNTSNNITQSFTQSGQSQNLQKFDRISKEEDNGDGDDQDFSQKYLFNNKNNNGNINNQKNNGFEEDQAEEPQRVTPIKYRQPKNPN